MYVSLSTCLNHCDTCYCSKWWWVGCRGVNMSHLALQWIIEPLYELYCGTLPTATAAYQGHRLADLHLDTEPVQHLES